MNNCPASRRAAEGEHYPRYNLNLSYQFNHSDGLQKPKGDATSLRSLSLRQVFSIMRKNLFKLQNVVAITG